MKSLKFIVIIFIFLTSGIYSFSQDLNIFGNLNSGKHTVGFKLIEMNDYSRHYPSDPTKKNNSRQIRIYIWYPAEKSNEDPMKLKEYLQMSVADFYPDKKLSNQDDYLDFIPVPLKKGMPKEQLVQLLKKNTLAANMTNENKGPFPLVVMGQGLYYESPVSHFILCELLASHGYVVATCPLLGTQYRLVNINVEDLETQVRDIEFIMGYANQLPQVNSKKTGIIGYDLGGMAGLILAMRNPAIRVFLSLDSGINYEHFSNLPKNHPSYQENSFTIPWMHMTQARFVEYFGNQQKKSSLFQRKKYGPSYLVTVPTTNHGCFSSYAALGLRNPVTGYWGSIEKNLKELHFQICKNTLLFFEAYLKNDKESLMILKQRSKSNDVSDSLLKIQYKEGIKLPPNFAGFVNSITNSGLKNVKGDIEECLKKRRKLVDIYLIRVFYKKNHISLSCFIF